MMRGPSPGIWRVETAPSGWDYEHVEETLAEFHQSSPKLSLLVKQRGEALFGLLIQVYEAIALRSCKFSTMPMAYAWAFSW